MMIWVTIYVNDAGDVLRRISAVIGTHGHFGPVTMQIKCISELQFVGHFGTTYKCRSVLFPKCLEPSQMSENIPVSQFTGNVRTENSRTDFLVIFAITHVVACSPVAALCDARSF